jgi:hypothetical protein
MGDTGYNTNLHGTSLGAVSLNRARAYIPLLAMP